MLPTKNFPTSLAPLFHSFQFPTVKIYSHQLLNGTILAKRKKGWLDVAMIGGSSHEISRVKLSLAASLCPLVADWHRMGS
jgi:hypothetical protein